MFDSIYVLLGLLFIKHWYIDFVNQSDEEVKHKGIYLDWLGVKHSLKHGILTAVIMSFFVYYTVDAIVLGMIDCVLHYHIDYVKMKYGNRDIKTPEFWAQLGFDQLAHYICYLWLVSLIF